MKTKNLILALLMATTIGGAFSQTRRQTVSKVVGVDVQYINGGNDDKKAPKPSVLLTIRGNQSAVLPIERTRDKAAKGAIQPFKFPTTYTYVDLGKMKQYVLSPLPTGDTISAVTPAITDNLKSLGTEKIAGWNCEHIQKSINSNTIDIWYTPDLGFRGSPMPSWGIPEGVVLKIARNGNVMLEAVNVRQASQPEKIMPHSWGRVVELADFNYEQKQSIITTVEVFSNDRIAFVGGKAPDTFNGNELYTVGGGTVILKKVALPENVDNYSIFAEVVQYSDGDAYDRTGSVFVIPTDKKQSFLDALSSKGINSLPAFISDTNKFPGVISTPDYTVPAELIRFFTPFGVRKFNHIKVKGQVWADSILYKQEVTHLAPLLRDSAWIAAYIGNWDSKGHIVSLKLKYYPDGDAKSTNQVIPLFNTTNLLEQAGQTYPTFFDKDSLRVTFTLNKPIKNAHLVYHTTGHGGWGGGDEFNKKVNTVYVDGQKIFSFIPWREDCATYRNSNPCSGNFSNGVSSSDLSRSNWCPGMVTNPVYIPVGDLAVGAHTISVQIPLGKPEGSSFSYWCVAGVLVGE